MLKELREIYDELVNDHKAKPMLEELIKVILFKQWLNSEDRKSFSVNPSPAYSVNPSPAYIDCERFKKHLNLLMYSEGIITQDQLADRLQVTKPVIRYIKNNAIKVKTKYANKLVEHLGEEILWQDEEKG